MPRRIALVIHDMLEAIDGIEHAVAEKSFEDFEMDWLLRHGVQRGMEITSEAARRLPDDRLKSHADVPWPAIRGMGNILRHEYHRISDRIVWNAICEHLPPLRRALLTLLRDVD